MKVHPTNSIRNIALVSHQGTGKTSLTEAMLFNAGLVTRMGTVEQGTTVSDFDEEEQRRGLSLSTSLIPIEANGLKLNILDTPGYTDFQGDVKNSLMVSDMAVVMIDASSGVEVGAEVYWGFADEFELPRMVLINKVDRENIRLEHVLDELNTIFDSRFVPVEIPMFEAGEFVGVIDLLAMKAWFRGDETPVDVPDAYADAAEEAHFALVEAAAESDDELLEKYFEVGELSNAEMWQGIRAGVQSRTFVPVAYAAGTANTGVRALTSLLTQIAPSPDQRPNSFTGEKAGEVIELPATDSGPLALYVWKSTADPFVGSLTYFRVISGLLKADQRYYNFNQEEEERFGSLLVMRANEQMTVDTMHAGDIGAVAKLNSTVTGDTLGDRGTPIIISQPSFPIPVYSVAVFPATQGDSAKMGPTLSRLTAEDPTLQWRQDPATKEAVLEGMGDVHVDVAIRRAAQLGVNLETAVPKVPYREAVTREGKAQYRHKKQTGGAGQFAEVHLRVEPLEEGEGFEFESKVFGGAISNSFLPSIEKGIKSVLQNGVIAGYPVVGVKAVVYDGKEHPVDSKDIAFQIAGREAFKEAFRAGSPVLMEPLMILEITVPESNMGDVIGDLSSRRGQVLGTEIVAGRAVITAQAPLSEVLRYSNDLRSFTQGRGVYTMKFSHYATVPSHIAEEIVAKAKKEEEES